jgi:nucleotide-binding universal stress UspA family protein
VDVDTEVAMGDPVEEILRAARTSGVDLLVMATHGRTGLGRVMFGSVASRVVSSGVKPVLLVRPATLA